MQHPAPNSTPVKVMSQNLQQTENPILIDADVVGSVWNETDGKYHYKLHSNGWGDGNIAVSVILKDVVQDIVILEPDKP